MMSVLIYQGLPAFALASILTYLSIPWIEAFSVRFGLTTVRTKPMSILGGAMIAIGAIASWALHHPLHMEIVKVLGLAMYFLALGVWDNKAPLAWWKRHLAQIFGLVMMVLMGIQINAWSWSFFSVSGDFSLLTWPITIGFGMLLLNSLLVLRRLDGFVCAYVGIVSGVLAGCSLVFGYPSYFILGASLSGACFSFYKYNGNPLRIYLGRSGIYVMGILLLIMSIQGVMQAKISSNIMIVLFLFALPLTFSLWQLPWNISHSGRRIPSFSERNSRLNRHPMVKKTKWIGYLIVLFSSAIVVTCISLGIPLLMILLFVAGSVYGGLVTGLWWIPTRQLKRVLVCFRY